MVDMADILPSVLNLLILFLLIIVVVPFGKYVVNKYPIFPASFRALVNAV